RDSKDASLGEIISEIASVRVFRSDDPDSHFFEVELRDVVRHRNDVLLNEAIVKDYLGQVAPVPFSREFSFGRSIQEFLDRFGAGINYEIRLNDEAVFRPHADSCEVRLGVKAPFTNLEMFEVPAVSDGIDAVGWILHSEYLGALPEKSCIKGMRLRIGNIQ